MRKNMGLVDRVVRILAAVLVLVLYLTHVISGPVAIVLGVIAVVFVVTGFVGVCPAYMPFRLSTLKKS
jgi:Inner membrane protein YgaP-like, transmembrane domain